MTKLRLILASVVILLLFGCATEELSHEGQDVSLNASAITKQCKEVGEVYGKGGGVLGGTISDEKLRTYALNNMRNKAAKLGATHILVHGNQLGGGLWSNTNAQISGTAFRCPKAR